MNRAAYRYFLAGLALLTLYGCPVNWSETYRYDEEQPFDLYALYELLEARPEGLTLVEDTLSALATDTLRKSNYMFVGHYPYYAETTVTRLLDYVERGNTAFLACRELPEDLAYHLFGDECYYQRFEDLNGPQRFPEIYRDSIVAELTNSPVTYPLVNIRYWQPFTTALTVVSEELLCDPLLDTEVIGRIDTSGINLLRLGWGEGDFYFLTTPLYLTNFYLVDSLQYVYAEAALAALGEGPVYWDEHHRNYRRPKTATGGRQLPRREYNGGRNLLTGNEALSYIQEQPELAMAWYTLLAGVFLFVIFRSRRRQRIIPLILPRENSSRQFIDTISRLVYQRGNHAALAQRELASLRFHLKERYGIRWREGDPPPDNLAERIGIPATVANRAVAEIRVAMAGKKMEEGDLERFYRAIEPLY